MEKFYKHHPAVFSGLLAMLILCVFTMLSPVALQFGDLGMDWHTLLLFTSVFAILAFGQFKSAAMQRRNGAKAIAVINYVFGVLFIACAVVVIIAGVDALLQ